MENDDTLIINIMAANSRLTQVAPFTNMVWL